MQAMRDCVLLCIEDLLRERLDTLKQLYEQSIRLYKKKSLKVRYACYAHWNGLFELDIGFSDEVQDQTKFWYF